MKKKKTIEQPELLGCEKAQEVELALSECPKFDNVIEFPSFGRARRMIEEQTAESFAAPKSVGYKRPTIWDEPEPPKAA